MTRRYPPSRAETTAQSTSDPAVLHELAQHRSSFVKTTVARNKHTSTETLRLLGSEDDPYVRSALAQHANTPTEVLAALADDTDAYVQAALAGNPRTPVPVLERLAENLTASVVSALVRNPSSPARVLVRLVSDQEPRVREGVASNPNTPDEALLALVNDRDPSVRTALGYRLTERITQWREVQRERFNGTRRAMSTVRIPVEPGGRFSAPVIRAFAASSDVRLALAAASQPDAPQDVLSALARHEDVWVRVRVAENRSATEAMLLTLLRLGDSEVVQAVASRSDLTETVLAEIAVGRMRTAHDRLPDDTAPRLLAHPESEVRAAAAKFAHRYPAAESVWQQMLDDGDRKVRVAAAEAMATSLLARHATHPCPGVRQVVAERISDPEVLAMLAGDASATVRRRVARNACVPAAALAALASDTDARVRSYAGERFLSALSSLS